MTPARTAAKDTNGSPAHLQWITGVFKLARNANRIGAIFNSFISSMDQIVLLECQFSLALVLVMTHVRRQMKLEKIELKESIGGGQCLKGELITTRIILCSQGCDSTTGNISSGIVNFFCMILITETKSEKKKIPRNTSSTGNIFNGH